MTTEAKTKLYKHQKANTLYLTIPSKITTDSTFPFTTKDKLTINIYNNTLLISKSKEKHP